MCLQAFQHKVSHALSEWLPEHLCIVALSPVPCAELFKECAVDIVALHAFFTLYVDYCMPELMKSNCHVDVDVLVLVSKMHFIVLCIPIVFLNFWIMKKQPYAMLLA